MEDNEEKTGGGGGGRILRHSRMDFQMKHRDDIMAKSASRNTERPGNATPYINSGQLYL